MFIKTFTIHLRRSGILTVYRDIISDFCKQQIKEEIMNSHEYRQYKISKFDEPRIHMLLASKIQERANQDRAKLGYQYHGVSLKARDIGTYPSIATLADTLAAEFHLRRRVWNAGVDVIVYRAGHDRIGWHADNTQDEKIILPIVISSPEKTRKVKII